MCVRASKINSYYKIWKHKCTNCFVLQIISVLFAKLNRSSIIYCNTYIKLLVDDINKIYHVIFFKVDQFSVAYEYTNLFLIFKFLSFSCDFPFIYVNRVCLWNVNDKFLITLYIFLTDDKGLECHSHSTLMYEKLIGRIVE